MNVKYLTLHCRVYIVDNTEVLVSYTTPVAARVNGKYYKTDEYYSKTTTIHVNNWIGDHSFELVSQDYLNDLSRSMS